MQKGAKILFSWAALFAVFIILFNMVSGSFGSSGKKVYSDLLTDIRSGQLTKIIIDENTVVAVKGDGNPIKAEDGSTVPQKYEVQIPSVDALYADVGDELEKQVKAGTLSQEVAQPRIEWLSFVSPVVLAVIIIAFWLFLSQGQSGRGANAFTKSRARLVEDDNKRKMKFEDVAGADEEKAELAEIVDFLKDPSKFIALGARIPKGVLLVGSPGTGKTLLARAVAGEAGVPFFSISGSDFVELYVGVGAARVRDLFEQAKKNKPCIVFIDEIDAVGRKRGAGMGGGHDEREQTLNQLLVEMDGFGVNEGIIMIAATNRPDILDPALLRPGRFDRQVVVDVPDVRGREEILKIHSRKKPLDSSVDLKQIAKTTVGYTGADLENLMNEAAIFAARRGHEAITKADLEDANVKVMMGTQKKSRVITEKEKRLTAFHEAGHAVLARIVDKDTTIHQVSIIPRGRAGGYTMYVPEEDHMYTSRNELMNRIIVLLGGRVAEQLTMDDISTGASSDIQRATELARQMVAKYGMSDSIGPVSYDSGEEVFIGRDFAHSKAYSEKTAAQIDDEVSTILNKQYAQTVRLLEENMDTLKRVAETLLEKETIDSDEFEAVFSNK